MPNTVLIEIRASEMQKNISLIAGDALDIHLDLPFKDLPCGFHQLFIRCQDTSGAWSLLGNHLFFVETNSTRFDDGVDYLEYFMHEDPEIGTWISINMSPGDTIIEDFSIPLDCLRYGFYTTYIRTKYSMDRYSILFKQLIFADTMLTPVNKGVYNLEYFMDKDLSLGQGTWNLLNKQLFFVDVDQTDTRPDIVKVECFLPGLGDYNGGILIPIFGDSVFIGDLSLSIQSLDTGKHLGCIRAMARQDIRRNLSKLDSFKVISICFEDRTLTVALDSNGMVIINQEKIYTGRIDEDDLSFLVKNYSNRYEYLAL